MARHPEDVLFSVSAPRSRRRRVRAYVATALLCVMVVGCLLMRDLPWGWHKLVALVFAGLTAWTFWEWTRPLESPEELLIRMRRVQQSDFGKQLLLNRPQPKKLKVPGYGEVEVRSVINFALFWITLGWWFTPLAPIAVRPPEVEDLAALFGREITTCVMLAPTGRAAVLQPPLVPPRARRIARKIRDDAGPYLLGLKALAQNQWQTAADYFDRAEKEGFDPLQVRLARAQNELFAGAMAEAADDYEKLSADAKTPASVLAQGAVAWMLAGEYGKADRLLASAQKRLADDAVERAAVAQVQSVLTVLQTMDLRKGEQLVQRVRESLPEESRDNDPLAVACLNNQGVIYVLRGDYQGAELLFKGAFDRWDAADDGEGHLAAVPMANLGVLDLLLGRYEIADQRLHRALMIRSRAGGGAADQKQRMGFDAAHLYTAAAGVHLANYELDDAGQDADRAMALARERFSENHPDIVPILVAQARRRLLESRYLQADSLLARAAGIVRRTFGAEHPNQALLDLRIAELRLREGRAADADALARDAEKRLTQHFSSKHWSVGEAALIRGLVAAAEDRPRDARPLFDRALQIKRDHLGKEHPEVAMVMGCLASLDNSPATYPSGIDQFARAIKIVENAWPNPHPWAAELYVGMARLHMAREKFAEAVPLLERALDIQVARLTAFHPDLARTRELLAEVLERQSPRPAERIAQLRKAAEEGRQRHRVEDRLE